MARPIALVGNPAADRGIGAKRLAAARSAFEASGSCAVWVTREIGDEARCAAEALEAGVVSLRLPASDFVAMASIARSGLERGGDAVQANFAYVGQYPTSRKSGSEDRRVDVGAVDGRYFLDVAGIGLDFAALMPDGAPVLRYAAPATTESESASRQRCCLLRRPGGHLRRRRSPPP